jgi:sugar-specific transcriptional regulator TrmB
VQEIFVRNKATQTLTKLGLTPLQATIYLSLLTMHKTTAKELSKHSKIARQTTYRILDELQEKGLVEKIVATPIEFTAMPLEESLPILIRRKKSQISETQKSAFILLKKLKGKKLKKLPVEEPYFCLISEKEANLLRIRKAINSSKKNIDIITTHKRFRMFGSRFGEEIRNSLKRRIPLRVIVEKIVDKNSLTKKIFKDLNRNSSLKLKHTFEAPLSPLWIFDDGKVVIVTSVEAGLGESPTLWSNTPSLIAVFRDYFEAKWITAFEHSSEIEQPILKSKLK